MKEAERAGETGFQVGSWRVHPTLHQLRREGREVRIEPKVMEVLVYLADRPDRVISRQELQDAVWGAPHLSEELPRRAISSLRKVFREDPRQPRYIETIPRSGYRLIAPVRPLAATASEPETRSRRGLALLAAGFGALLIGTAFWIGLGTRGASEVGSGPRSVPVTASPGLEYDPALSPDGTRVAFLRSPSIEPGAGVELRVRLLDSESELTLTERPADFDAPIESPAWSPDGTAVAFLRWSRGAGWGIHEVPALGGAERKVLDLPGVAAAGLAWSPDGRSLAVGLQPGPEEPFAIHRIRRTDLRVERLSSPPPGTVGDRFPAWSPEGDRIAFLRTARPDASSVWVWNRGGEERVVLPGRRKIADLDWQRDGRHLLLAVHEDGRHRVRRLDLDLGTSRRLDSAGPDARWLSASRRDDRLLIARTRWTFGVWRYPADGAEPEPLPELSSTFFDEGLALSPDGSTLALTSTRSGATELWMMGLDGSRARRLTDLGGGKVAHPCWLPDGSALVFEANPGDRSELWRVGRDGGALTPLSDSPHDETAPALSRDGRTLYFASDQSGDWQIWSRPLAGGAARQRTTGGGFRARETPDGAALLFTRWGRPGLWRLPLDGGAEQVVLADEPKPWQAGNWRLRDREVVLVTRDEAGRERLSTFDLDERRWSRHVPLTGTPVQPSLTLTAEGDAYLVQLDRIDSDLALIEPGSAEE